MLLSLFTILMCYARVLYAMDEAQTRDYISVGIIKDAASRLYRDEDGLFYYIKVCA